MERLRPVALLVFLPLCGSVCPASTQGVTFQTLALSNEPAPGLGPDILYGGFGTLSINRHGEVAYNASLRHVDDDAGVINPHNDTLIYTRGLEQPPELVVRSGDPAAGFGPSIRYADFNSQSSTTAINDRRDVVFLSRLFGVDHQPSVFVASEGAIERRAASGDLAPGLDGEYALHHFSAPYHPPVAPNNAGDIAYRATLRRLPGGVPTYGGSPEAIFGPSHGPGSAAGLIAIEGGAAPGVSNGKLFEDFYSAPLIDDLGGVAFRATLNDLPSRDEALFATGPDGQLRLIAKEGTHHGSFYDQPLINAGGDLAYRATIGGSIFTNEAVFLYRRDPASGPRLIAREGDLAPIEGETLYFGEIHRPGFALNDHGDVAFGTRLRAPRDSNLGPVETPGDAIVAPGAGPGSALEVVVRRADFAPYTDVETGVVNFSDLTMNNEGELSFRAYMTEYPDGPPVHVEDEVPQTTRIGLFTLTDLDTADSNHTRDDLRMLARVGDPFVVQLHDGSLESRVVSQIGRETALTDSGRLAFQLSFTDGSAGVFVASTQYVPEPATTLMAPFAAGVVLTTDRRGKAGSQGGSRIG